MENTVLSVFGLQPRFIGGGEAFAHQLSIQLARHGWKSVLTFEKAPMPDVARYLDLPGTAYEILPGTTTWSRETVSAFAALLRRHRPRILHLHFTTMLGPMPWLAFCHGVQSIFITDQTSRPEGFIARPAPWWKRTARALINRPVTRLIAVSEYARQCLLTLDQLPASAVELIYNASDLSLVDDLPATAASFRKRFRIPDGRAIVAQVCWMIDDKGLADLLEAARQVIVVFPEVQFVLVGDGARRASFAQLAEDLGIANHVTFTGLLENPQAAGVYAAADILCLMSRWEEAFGWVNSEAMAHCKPIVATRAGGIPEVIADGVTGYLVPRRDTAAMAARILELLRDPDLRRRMGRAGRRAVEEKFELTKNVARLLASYGICPCGK